MVDIEAPIIPGKMAAGIAIGTPISAVLAANPGIFTPEPVVSRLFGSTGTTIYRSSWVDLWVTDGTVDQIMVHGNYRGKLRGKVGIGSTIADVEATVGLCIEDIYDNLVVEGVSGLSFEISGVDHDLTPVELRNTPITEIFVFTGATPGGGWVFTG